MDSNIYIKEANRQEAEHVVFLFELALKRARQLLKEGYHPEDLYVNASAPLEAYERTLD